MDTPSLLRNHSIQSGITAPHFLVPKLIAEDQSISEIAKQLFDSLQAMGQAGEENKLKFNAGVIETRGLSEAGGETFTRENLETFINNLEAFISNPYCALSDLEKIEQAIPKAIEGLSNLQNVYESQYLTAGTSWLPGFITMRSSHQAEIASTIEWLKTSLELIKVQKDERTGLREAGMAALISENELNTKSLQEIKVNLKSWGVLVDNHGDSSFDKLCQSLIGVSSKLLSNEEKYTILAKCIYVLDKPSQSIETEVGTPPATSTATGDASTETTNKTSKKFDQASAAKVAHDLKAICSSTAKTDPTKVLNIKNLIKTQVDVFIAPPKEEEINLEEWDMLEVEQEETVKNSISTANWLWDTGVNTREMVAQWNPALLDTAETVSSALVKVPYVGFLSSIVYGAVKTAKFAHTVAAQTKTKTYKPETLIAMSKDYTNPKYTSALIAGLPQMSPEKFAALQKGLEDKKFTALLEHLNALDDTLLERLPVDNLPEDKKIEIELIRLNQEGIDLAVVADQATKIADRATELGNKAAKLVSDALTPGEEKKVDETDQKTVGEAEAEVEAEADVAADNVEEIPAPPVVEEELPNEEK